MLFKGTKRRGVGDIAGTVESAGGDINAYTSMDHTVYNITISARYLETALDVLADAIQHSTLDADELEKEKLVVIEEIKRGLDNPGRVYTQGLFAAVFREHPYGRKVIGTPGSVSSVSRADMKRFLKKYYVPGNMKLVVVGGVDVENTFDLAAGYFTAPSRPVPARHEVTEPGQEETRFFRMTADTEPARVSLAFPIGSLTDPETPVLDLLAAVLSEGGSSRLPRELRDRGVALSAWSYAYTPRDPGVFMLGATARQDGLGPALGGLVEQAARLQRELVPEEELERARDQILTGKIFSRESVEGQAGEIGYSALTLGSTTFNDTYYSRLQAVDAADLRQAARRVFMPHRASVGFLTRQEEDQPGDDEVTGLLKGSLKADGGSRTSAGDVVFRGELANGIQILVREDRRLPLVAMRMGVLGGSRYETEETQGAFNLMGHLLTRGTETSTAAQLAEKLDGMSASAGGFSGRNSFGVTGKFLSRDVDEGFAILRQLLTGATFPQQELELMQQRLVSSIRARKDNLTSLSLDLFRSTLYREHPYRFPVMGTEESVKSLTREVIRDLYRSVVRPKGMVISVAGDVSARQVWDLASRHFGGLEGGRYDPGPLRQEFSSEGIRTARVSRQDKAQTHIVMGFPGPDMKDPDMDRLAVLNAVLTGQGGRLFTELRDNLSLAYSVFSFVAPGVDPGFFAFGIAVSPERESEAVEAFLDEIRRVQDEPVSDREMERARRYLTGSHTIGLQTMGSRAEEPFFPVLYGQDLEESLAYTRRINSVTAAQVKEAANRWLDTRNYTLVVVEGNRDE
jgi:zinc protease